MSEQEQDLTAAEAPPSKEQSTTPAKMSFSIWPPAERTREAVVKRLVETLSTTSVLSKRYGTLPEDEASAAAALIEEEAFTTAASSAASDDDGIQILQVYSKEISKRMLDAVKARSSSSPAAAAAAAATTAASDEGSSLTDDDSKVETPAS